MKKVLLIFAIFIAFKAFAQESFLPHYPTALELQQMEYLKNNPTPPVLMDPNPPPGPVRTMAEWEEIQALQITWTPSNLYPILRQIVDYAQEECMVYIICSDSNAVKTYLTNGGVPLSNLKFLITTFNSIWCRDYGPWTVYSQNIDTLRIIDWKYNRTARPQDDATPVFIANTMGVPIHQTLIAPNDLVNTGGNFMADGHGTAFASKLILTENGAGNPYGVSVKTESQINSIMNSYMGISRYIKMDILPYDQIHHIDMHMKLLDEETLLVGQYPTGVADGPQIELNLQYVLNNFQTCFGKPYKVVRIPMPPHNGNYPPTGNYRTYTNSVFVNKTVIVPTYELQYDTTALRIYRQALPGYNVVGIDCNAIIPSLGAIHCITKEIGVNQPVFISHSALRNTNNTSQPYEVKAYIKHKSGIANARMYWSLDTASGFTQVNMTNIGDTFRANIPAQPLNTKVYYYISATSVSGKTVTKPLPAPRGNIQFTVTNVTGIEPVAAGIPNKFSLHQNYPNPFNPVTKIKFDIAKNTNVKLSIYDITGKEVLKITDAYMTAGSYSYQWNASGFASGIYFYRLDAGNYSEVKKMILVK